MPEPTACLAITEDEDAAIPDALLSSQVPSPHAIAPERVLVSRILMDAVECVLKHHDARNAARRALFEEAMAWIFGPPQIGMAFSFVDTCAYLGLSPDCVRDGLRQWLASRPVATRGPLLRRDGRHARTNARDARAVRRVA